MSKAKPSSPKSSSVVVLDLGGHTAKIGLASHPDPQILPNCIFKAKSEKKRQFISSQINECKDQHQLFHMYPFSGGFLTNWELQERILDYFFGSEMLNVDCRQSHLIMTEPYFNFQSLKKLLTEAIFEDFGFESAFLCPPAYLSALQFRTSTPNEPTCLVIDSGHSFTHIVPVVDGNISWKEVIRVSVGGKILTNHLKQRVTFTQINVMDETHVINRIKETLCFVSTDLKSDFERSGQTGSEMMRTFVLPDYVTNFEGFAKPPEQNFDRPAENEQLIRLTADRFVVPEILFHPSIIGDGRMGISEACVESIKKFPRETQLYLFRNIVVTGGTSRFPGLHDRLMSDISPEVPEYGEVEVMKIKDPMTTAWYGGKILAESPTLYNQVRVTRAEYEEFGENICEKRFIRNYPKQRNA